MSQTKPVSHMNERELLLAIHSELGELKRKVENQDRDWTIAMHYMHSINLAMGRKAEAEEILAMVQDRRPTTNGSSDELPTAPSGEVPDPPAS